MTLAFADQLSSVADVKGALGISDATEDSLLAALIGYVSALITESLGRTFLLATNAANPITEYLSGRGTRRLVLRHRPVQGPALTGNTTAGSPVVTGLSASLGVFAGAGVMGPLIPSGTAVLSVQSATQITLTQPATATAAGTALLLGPAVWLDDTGCWGTGTGSFGPTTQLFEGADWVLERDQPDRSSRRGILARTVGTWDALRCSDAGALSTYTAGGTGNIKVTYVAGWTAIPADLELACIRCVGKARNSKWYGDLVASESFDGQSYSLEGQKGAIVLGLLGGDVAPILARYRNIALAGR